MDVEFSIETPKIFMGRKVAIEKQFLVYGTFKSMYAANGWIRENGYDFGSTCALQPTAIMKGDYYSYDLPHKWKNFSSSQKASIAGVMTGDLRDGPVFVRIFEQINL